MKWKNVRLIFTREVRDQLRDRRTIFMVFVLPLLLYPAMGIGMLQLATQFTEQPRTVVILGSQHLPPPQLLEGDRFVSTWFQIPDDASKLKVITDGPLDEAADPDVQATTREILAQAVRLRDKVAKRSRIEADILNLERERSGVHSGNDSPRPESSRDLNQLRAEYEQIDSELIQLFSTCEIQVLILIPDGFADNIDQVNRRLAERKLGASDDAPSSRPVIIKNRADDKSVVAYSRVKEVMDAWEEAILKERLSLAGLPETLPKPVDADEIDLAGQEQLTANLWSKLFPAMLIIMAVTGAFYPAVDLAAGEKERGTMETLLICPATRSEIVIGKFMTVMLFSVATALLNLASLGFTGLYIVSVAGSGSFSTVGDPSLPSPLALMWLLILLIPLAALFSALCLALATFARSSKEGQYYLTPLLTVTLGLTVFCLSPAAEITPFYSVMPVMGIALLLKAFLLSPVQAGALYGYVVPVLVTSVAYSLLALWWAIEQFKREDVLFRESERFELGLWIRHLLRDKEPTPSFTEAGFCFILIMLLQFGSMKFMGDALVNVPENLRGTRAIQLLIIQQLVIIACPALFMGLMLTTSFGRTFRLRLPNPGMFAAAVLLSLALHPLTIEMLSFMNSIEFFPPVPPRMAEVIGRMTDLSQPWWFVLLAFAVAPAICEEAAFRGFMLSGFQRGGRPGVAIMLSSVAFGVMHMFPQQVFNAMLLGLVLGLLAVRSNSLLPGIVFHLTYNTLGVLHSRILHEAVDTVWLQQTPCVWFIRLDSIQGTPVIRYTWPTLVFSAVVVILLLRWLSMHSRSALTAAALTTHNPDSFDGSELPSSPKVRVG